MKRKIFTSVLLLPAVLAGAQTIDDALCFSKDTYLGTARTMAMGNAVTALGGDLGSITINPAGSAVNNFSQVVITPGMNIAVNKAQGTVLEGATEPFCFGDANLSRKTKASIPNVGFVINFDTNRNRGLMGVSLGMTVNATNYFLDNVQASGNHLGTSFAGRVADSSFGYPSGGLSGDEAYDSYDWRSVLGWQSGMTSTIEPDNDKYVGVTELLSDDGKGGKTIEQVGELNQKYGRLMSGNKYDYALNIGFNVSDWIFIGANLGVTSLSYSYDDYIREEAVNPSDFELIYAPEEEGGPDRIAHFSSLKYQYSYSASGSGIYGKFGVLFTPGEIIRIGASVQTPTVFSMKEYWKAAAEVKFDNRDFNGSATSPEGNWRYKFISPFKADFGVAATISGLAAISADYEIIGCGGMKFKESSSVDNSAYDQVNSDIRDLLCARHMLRVGAEVKPIPALAIRAGYNFLSSGRRGVNSNDHSVSFGLGYSSNGSFFADVAVKSLLCAPEFIYPYDMDYDYYDARRVVSNLTPEIRNVRTLVSCVATVGFRF